MLQDDRAGTETDASARLLRALFAAGIEAVGGEVAVSRALADEPVAGPVRLLAFGKAADAMTRGALASIGDALIDGLVITKHGHLTETLRGDVRLRCLESSHPVPDASSLAAGDAMLDYLGSVRNDEHLLVLVSGGGSALVEALAEGIDLPTLQARTDALLAEGAPIGEINRIRRGLSRLKGGRALAMLANCRITQLLISDVPGDRLEDIASGPFIGPAGTCVVNTRIVASNAIARQAVAAAAQEMGLAVIDTDGSLDGDVSEVARDIAAAWPTRPGSVRILGGEPTLTLPRAPGRGGRNQHLAALLARPIAGRTGVSVLVCGTDGTDGPTDAAGGLVDAGTLERAEHLGLDLDDALAHADTGRWLQGVDALVTTGPTGTNVMDLAIVLCAPDNAQR